MNSRLEILYTPPHWSLLPVETCSLVLLPGSTYDSSLVLVPPWVLGVRPKVRGSDSSDVPEERVSLLSLVL